MQIVTSVVRGEFQGFVAVVNKPISAKFNKLSDHANEFIAGLPWEKHFEKDKYSNPEFCALDVLTFCSTAIPSGMNLPNYDHIRQKEGFKNLNMSNVLKTRAPSENLPFLTEKDKPLFRKYRNLAFELHGMYSNECCL